MTPLSRIESSRRALHNGKMRRVSSLASIVRDEGGRGVIGAWLSGQEQSPGTPGEQGMQGSQPGTTLSFPGRGSLSGGASSRLTQVAGAHVPWPRLS